MAHQLELYARGIVGYVYLAMITVEIQTRYIPKVGLMHVLKIFTEKKQYLLVSAIIYWYYIHQQDVLRVWV